MQTRNASRLAHLVADGVVTRRQLLDAGADRGLLDREVAAGRWCRPFRDIALTGAEPTPHDLARAALLAAGPSSAITGLTACRTHGLRDVPAGGPIDLLVPVRRRLQVPDGVRLRRTQHGADVPLRVVGGLRVVQPEQAVVDAALRLRALRDVRALVLAGLSDGRLDAERLDVLLGRAPRRGSGPLRRSLTDAQRGAASAPEAELVDLLLPVARRRRLTLLVNADVLRGGLLLGRLDLLLLEAGVAVEVDSLRHHGSGADLEATLRRHERLTAAGLRVVHVTPWAVRTHPEEVLALVLGAVRTSEALPGDLQVRPRHLPVT